MKARCKFRVTEVEKIYGSDADRDMERVKMSAWHDESNPADTAFAKSTPSGTMEFTLTNPNLVGTFRPGQFYYVDLVTVE